MKTMAARIAQGDGACIIEVEGQPADWARGCVFRWSGDIGSVGVNARESQVWRSVAAPDKDAMHTNTLAGVATMDPTKNVAGQPSLKGFCDHCGNTTFQTITATEVSSASGKPATYTLTRCSICDGLALREHPGDWNAPLRSGEKPPKGDIPFTQLWPPTASFSSEVPDRIRAIYEEARLVRKQSPSSFVVQLRRAYEALARDRGAEGRTLNAQVQSLIDQGQLPPVFAEMIHISRMIGNLGAHDAEKDVSPMDAEVSDQFLKAILEYLYVAPALLSRVKSAVPPRADPKPTE